MTAKKSTPKPAKNQQKKTAKARTTTEPKNKNSLRQSDTPKSVTQRDVLDAPVPEACPQGGEHEWTADECTKCHEPKPQIDIADTGEAFGGSQETLTDDKPSKKPSRAPKPKSESKPKRLSALDAAAKVLAEAGESMTTSEMVEAMAAKGYWSSPNGQTPAATLYSAILRQINTKGTDARFKKTDRGRFALNR